MPDRRSLDLAVLELIGVSDAKSREELCDRLYFETTVHFRAVRIVEIQKQEQRQGVISDRLRVDDLVSDVWDALTPDDRRPVREWLTAAVPNGQAFQIPEGKPQLHDANDMFSAKIVYFSSGATKARDGISIEYPSRPHAELIAVLATQHVLGDVQLPRSEAEAAALLVQYNDHCELLRKRVIDLAKSRTEDEEKVADILGLISSWLAIGKK
jgi:hypothetical protein